MAYNALKAYAPRWAAACKMICTQTGKHVSRSRQRDDVSLLPLPTQKHVACAPYGLLCYSGPILTSKHPKGKRCLRIAMCLQAEQQEDPNLASRQMEERKSQNGTKLQRVNALSLHLNHNKKVAQEEHKCHACHRPLNPSTELQPFLSKQVCPPPFSTPVIPECS